MIYVKRGKQFDIQYWYTLQKRLYLKNADCQIIWQYAPCRNVYNNFILQQPFNTSARNDFPHSFSLQLQVNWGIFVLFDPLRRVGLMYINVFWYIVYHPVYKQRTKRHGGAIFFNISDTIGISLSMCGSVLVQGDWFICRRHWLGRFICIFYFVLWLIWKLSKV